MDTSQKVSSSSDSETANSDIIDVESDYVSVKSSSSISSISVGDDKVSNPEFMEEIPHPSVEKPEQEHTDASKPKLTEKKQDHPLSKKETEKLPQVVGECSKKTKDIKRTKVFPTKTVHPLKRQRLESCSDPENVSKLRSSSSSEHSMNNNDNETLDTSDIPPAVPEVSLTKDKFTVVNINNSYFYTPQTRIIHKQYIKLFDFKKFRQARSIDIKSYGKVLSITEVPLFLSRFLLEDLLDFVDFLNGKKTELFYPENVGINDPFFLEVRQLAFVRANFTHGIQQLESQTIKHLLEQLSGYIKSKSHTEKSSSGKNNQKTAETIECYNLSDSEQSEVIDIASENGSPENSEGSEIPSGKSSPVNDRILQPDPEIEEMSVDDKMTYFGGKRREIVKSVFSCMCSTRLVLDFCLEPDYIDERMEEFEQRLKKYLADIKEILETLVKIRDECTTLLYKIELYITESNVTSVIDIKILVANALKDLLRTLSTINSKFLEN